MYRALLKILFILLFVLSGITSNIIAGIPVKTLVMLSLLVVIFLGIVDGVIKIYLQEIYIVFGVFIFISIFGFLGFYNGYEYTALQHSVKVLSFFMPIVLILLVVKSNCMTADELYYYIKYMFWSAIIAKSVFEIFYILGVCDGSAIKSYIEEIFATEVMTLGLADNYLLRIATIVDVIPLSIFPFLMIEEKSYKKKLIIWLVVLLYVYINFSRMYMVQFITFSFLVIFPNRLYFSDLTKHLISVAIFFMILFGIFSFDIVNGLQNRFIGIDADASDLSRFVQIQVFLQEIPRNFLLGQGLGSYISGFIRSEAFPFLYEMEYLALLYQLGIFGMFFLYGVFFMIVYEISFHTLNFKYKLLMFFSIIFILIRPMTNPMFFASSSSMVLLSLIIFSYRCE